MNNSNDIQTLIQISNNLSINNNQENIDSNEESNQIVSNWLNLQKIIKEEITLHDIILKQLSTYRSDIFIQYEKYYKSKLKARETQENVANINTTDLSQTKGFELLQNAERILGDVIDPIQNLFLLMRGNFNYIIQTISIIDQFNMAQSSTINTLIELFCQQFFDSLEIPEPGEDELLMLCYFLLQKEINNKNSTSVSDFLDENNTFVGKFIKSYTKKHELNTYLSTALKSLILSIENSDDKCFELNPERLCLILKDDKHSNSNSKSKYKPDSRCSSFILVSKTSDEEYLTQNIPKTTININKEASSINYFDKEDNIPLCDTNLSEKTSSTKPISQDEAMSSNRYITKGNSINMNYLVSLNQEELINLNQKEQDPNLRYFYLLQLERISHQDIYTNKKFIQSLNAFNERKQEVLIKYKHNFLRIKEYIDILIQSLIDKMKTIPYTLRCICKVIYILIHAKFPKLTAFQQNAFIGEFIFGKCILPTLLQSDLHLVITTTIIGEDTLQCLRIIAKVLTKINQGLFFDGDSDTDYTLFNYYILEVTPLINAFYSQLIDVKLPKALDDIIKKQLNNGFGLPKKANIRSCSSNKKEIGIFDNSKRDVRGIKDIHCCICYSIEDILLLLKIIKPKIQSYATIDAGGFLEKTIEKIAFHEYELSEIAKKAPNRYFFLLFRDPPHKNIEALSHENQIKKSYSFFGNDENRHLVLERIKFCIKKVLTGLNMINLKDYSYLDSATSNSMFLNAMSDTLRELEEFNENSFSSSIPLKWYSGYIYNNKMMIPIKYQDNDYEKLYNELLDEEKKELNTLKENNNQLMTNNGLNIRFAEKIIEKVQKSEFMIKQIERMMKMKKFISWTEIDVCIMTESEIEALNEKKAFSFFSKKSTPTNDEAKLKSIIRVSHLSNCYHKTLTQNKKSSIDKVNKSKRHAHNLTEFITKFGKCKEIREDILRVNPENKIYEALKSYLDIVKEKLKQNPIFKSNSESEHMLIIEKISELIMKSIYHDVFPENPIPLDESFYNKTIELSHISPAHLEIKALYVNELNYASNCICKINEGHFAYEKLNWISMAYKSLNSIIKFSSGKDEEAGADELSPIFQYIIIKAKPRRFYSNIQYIKTFLPPVVVDGKYGYLLALMESSAEFISKISLDQLEKIKDEFLRSNNINNTKL